MRTQIGPPSSARWPSAAAATASFARAKATKKGVALGVDLDAAVAGEGLPEDAPVLGERVGVGVAELVQQACRALDVGEEEGDGAGRELAHLSRAANASETASSMDSNLPSARRASNRSSARRERSSRSTWSATARAYVSRFRRRSSHKRSA